MVGVPGAAMNILDKIMSERRADVAEARGTVPVELLKEMAAGRAHHSLVERVAAGSCIIAESKKASPSAGLLRPDYDPAALAREYEDAGAGGISVLTEPRHFLGDESHLRAVREAVSLPVLRKDFMCDVYQVYEAAAWGADVILLIIAALESDVLCELHAAAVELGLDVLAEAHTAGEVDAALDLEGVVVGVNSRNLKTLQTDLAVARDLAERIPADRAAVAESGIRNRSDIEELAALGYGGFLIGESLVGAVNPGAKLRELLGAV